MAGPGAWVVGVGLVTAVGDSAAQTATSVRAGISRYRESAVRNARGAPMTLALLPDEALPPLATPLAAVAGLTSRQRRMLRLAAPALREALAAAPPGSPPPLFLAGPEPLEGRPPPADEAFLDLLHIQARGAFAREGSSVFPSGRAGGFQALAAALEALARGTPSALVGGVDTFLDLYLLGTLDREGRVLAEGVLDGFCPGEGAGFLLLSPEPAPGAAFLHPPGLAAEPGHRYAQEPYRGDGLAQAIALALAPVEGRPVPTVFGSLNGESLGAREWGVSVLRNRAGLAPDFRFEHPADCFGDVGAAFAPTLAGLAALGLARGYRRGPALVWCSSEHELRGAACVSVPSGEEA